MKIVLIVCVVLILLYLFLIWPRVFHKPDRTGFMNVHYAHRGLHDNETDAPENSLSAFQKAVDAGYGMELDVQLTKDEIPVVFHDASLKRMCGVDGKVWKYTYEELKQFKLAKSNETIPTFESVLKLIDGKYPLIVEYKLDRPQTRVCELGNELLSRYHGTYCIESFHPFALMWYKKHRPDVMRGQLSEEFFREKEFKSHKIYTLVAFLLTNVLTRPDFIAYNHKYESNISRRICRKLGALSVAYTIQSQKQYEKAKNKFDLFIFDSFIPED